MGVKIGKNLKTRAFGPGLKILSYDLTYDIAYYF